MTRVLVTGAGGFLGGALVRELSQAGYGIRAVLRGSVGQDVFPPHVEQVTADVRDREAMKAVAVGCDLIVHLAAKVHELDGTGSDRDYDAVNVRGTENVLEGALASGARRLVFASSVKVFGEETVGCVDETCPPDPRTPYARSKWRAEQLIHEVTLKGSLKAVSLRLAMVYGPTRKGNMFRMISAIDRGRFPPLPKLPAWRSMLHVGNFVNAVRVSLERETLDRPAYVVADAAPYSVTAIYESLCRGLGRRIPSWRMPMWALAAAARCGDVVPSVAGRPFPLSSAVLQKLVGPACYSSAAMTRELGYRPDYSFESAVPELIAFYRKHANAC